MDRTIAFDIGIAAFAAAVIAAYVVYRYRQARARRAMQRLLQDYFEEKIAVGELGDRAREAVGRRFLGGSAAFAEAMASFHRAVDAARARQPPNEDKPVRQLAALKNEFGMTDRYLNEGWKAGRE